MQIKNLTVSSGCNITDTGLAGLKSSPWSLRKSALVPVSPGSASRNSKIKNLKHLELRLTKI